MYERIKGLPVISSLPIGITSLFRPSLLSSLAISARVPFLFNVFSTQRVWSSNLVSMKNSWLGGVVMSVEKLLAIRCREVQCKDMK